MGKKFVVSCSRPGMRRNGKQHEAAATYDEKDWTEEQWAAFDADPAFTVTPLEEAAADTSNPDAIKGLLAEIEKLKSDHVQALSKLRADQDNMMEAHGKALKAKDDEVSKLSARVAELEKQLADQAKASAKK